METCYICQTYISCIEGAPEVVAKCHRNLKPVVAARNILEILRGCFSCQQYFSTVRSLTSVARRPAVLDACEKCWRWGNWVYLGVLNYSGICCLLYFLLPVCLCACACVCKCVILLIGGHFVWSGTWFLCYNAWRILISCLGSCSVRTFWEEV